MRDPMLEVVINPVTEARRYVENAKELLKNHGQLDYETQHYCDRKYVRMAGNTLWNGMLLILDATFHVKTNENTRPHIMDYKNAVNIRDKKLLHYVEDAYDIMHISMGYDGVQNRATCNEAFRLANEIIDRCATMLA